MCEIDMRVTNHYSSTISLSVQDGTKKALRYDDQTL